MTKVECNFCFEIMEEKDFVEHAKEEHAKEIIDDCMTHSGIMEYATRRGYL